jgi:hypothetical protein
MSDKANIANLGVVVSARGSGLLANDGNRVVVAVGGAYRQSCNPRAMIAMRSSIRQMAFSLLLGSVSIACAQMDYDHEIQLVSVGYGLPGASASRHVTAGDFTNQPVAAGLAGAPNGDPDPGLSYAQPRSQQSGEAEYSQPSLISRIRLADLARTVSPQGWLIGDDGVLSYTARKKRWHLVLGYAPDLSAIRKDFAHLNSFSLVWQYSFGKHKPASWVSASQCMRALQPPS